MQIPTTLWSHAPTLAVIVVSGGLLIRYFPAIVAIFTKDPERRRVALEVLRLRRKDAAKIPTYLAADDPPPTKTPAIEPKQKRKTPGAGKAVAGRLDSE